MKFFLPFWFSDHIYSSFNPWEDDWRPKSDSQKYIWHQSWPRLPLDGVLISRFNIENNKKRFQSFREMGVYSTLEIPRNIPTFGDCGAWGYIKERRPPYDPNETLEFYREMKFKHACTIDHIIFPETFSERYERLEITLRNAEQMMTTWSSDPGHYGFELVGVVQGWDPQSYYDCARQIIDMGFSYIALGGQSRSPSRFTVDVLKQCHSLWENRDVKVHIFGLGRWNLFDAFRKFGVYSFDNAYHRRAWLSLSNNYELGNESYTAVRIPMAKGRSQEVTERRVMKGLRELNTGDITSSKFLEILREHDGSRVQLLAEEYKRTLTEEPWKRCECIMCKELGIHVVIFRSNERNMRRGFHNLWNFYQRLSPHRDSSLENETVLAV